MVVGLDRRVIEMLRDVEASSWVSALLRGCELSVDTKDVGISK